MVWGTWSTALLLIRPSVAWWWIVMGIGQTITWLFWVYGLWSESMAGITVNS